MKIDEILKKESVISDLVGKNKPEVIKEMAQCLKNNNIIKNDQALFETLMEREKLGSTGIGENVAIPHGKSDELTQIIVVFAVHFEFTSIVRIYRTFTMTTINGLFFKSPHKITALFSICFTVNYH